MKAKLLMAVLLAGLAFASAAFGSIYQFTAMNAGSMSALSFSGPNAIARDHQGNLYVTDMTTRYAGSGVIYKINADQSSYAVFASGLGFAGGIVCDSKNNLYVADGTSFTIKKITPDGAVSVYAGATGVVGNADGDRLSARVATVSALAIGVDDSIYFFSSGKLRKISPSGTVSTVAGSDHIENNIPLANTGFVDGQGSSALFGTGQNAITVDPFGNVFVVDSGNNAIRKVTPDGVVSTTDRQMVGGIGICRDTLGTMYVTQLQSSTINVYDPQGNWTKQVGSSAPYSDLTQIIVDPAGVLYAVNNSNFTGHVITVGTLTAQVVANGRLANLSARSKTGSGDSTLIVGFVTNGSIPALLRGVGPAMGPLGDANFVPNPTVTLNNSNGVAIANNDDWDGTQASLDLFSRLGAFPLSVGSKDASLYMPSISGLNTVFISGKAGVDGDALAEAYDASASLGPVTDPSTHRFVNLSARGQVLPGSPLIGGFVIVGAPRKVLIRATGQTLGKLGVGGALQDAVLTLYDNKSQPITANDNWGGDVVIQDAASQVHAFGWAADSTDAALVVTLQPGNYTAVVTGKNNTSGNALVEIYEVQ